MHVFIKTIDKTLEFDLMFDPDFYADCAIKAYLEKHGTAEPEVFHFLTKALRPGDKVIDVGANVGFLTIPMAQLVGPTGRVYAVEPGPQNKLKLQENLLLNDIDENVVILYFKALWNEVKEVKLYLSPDSGLNSLAEHEHTTGNTNVQAMTLDSMIDDMMDWPRLIKIDAEGAEEHILRGGKDMLRPDLMPFVICELNEASLARLDSDQKSLRGYMKFDRGYETFALRPDGGMPILVPFRTRMVGNVNSNILFSTVDAVGELWDQVQI